ncbi:hypothetical protein LAC1533_0331 [Ligilactobacillus acidipiscis]|uniref:Uncharacterized protein n=1 Tax=Ligilactobacillus acidipiscis TaxID=89059 RepID=A0A1K1KLJ3_9LACO|nr:hypothetical protein LAC1533_0331 [Ligilactobacillus acidipiscis]
MENANSIFVKSAFLSGSCRKKYLKAAYLVVFSVFVKVI